VTYRVELTARAERELDALPDRIFRQVRRRIDALAIDPRPRGSRQLEGSVGLWRVRSGDFRIIYQIQEKRLLVLVVRIGHRREVYRGV
jgi:mRNA interferase RelE/StbE